MILVEQLCLTLIVESYESVFWANLLFHGEHDSFFKHVLVQRVVPFQEDSAELVEENTDIPDYLPEEESPSQEPDKAVTRVGSITDGMGWLSTAANFVTRSFYWWPLPVFLPLHPIFLQKYYPAAALASLSLVPD